MNHLSSIALVVSLAVLAGCEGGSSNGDGNVEVLPLGSGFLTLGPLDALGPNTGAVTGDGTPILPLFRGLGAGVIQAGDYTFKTEAEVANSGSMTLMPLPAGGTATFQALVGLLKSTELNNEYTGNGTFVADYGAATLTGTVGDFGYFDDSATGTAQQPVFPTLVRTVGGTLDFTQGVLTEVSNGGTPVVTVSGNLTGVLDDGGNNLTITSEIAGYLVDDSGQTTILAFGVNEETPVDPDEPFQSSTFDDGSGPQDLDVLIIAN